MKTFEAIEHDYPVRIELPVLWGHMDALQHVNNVQYFRYMESARVAYGEKLGVQRLMKEEGLGTILGSTSCSFLKSLRYPDTVIAACRTTRLTESTMEHEYALFSTRLQRVAAKGTAIIVAYDYEKLARAVFPSRLIEEVLKVERGLRLSSP